MKRNLFHFLLLLVVLQFLSSCVNQKKFIYFQKKIGQSDTIALPPNFVSKIKSGDVLSIYVTSLSTDASTFFNPYNAAAAQTSGSDPINSTADPGYLVDGEGKIEIPLVGQVKVGGLTTSEARDLIRADLKKYLKEPTVNVRVINYKISILGEVGKPAVYAVPNESISLTEVLSMAGDIGINGRRDNIMIIREQQGKKEIGYVNLNSREVFSSPYYYLHANDLVYVEPMKNKMAQGSFGYRIVPFVVGIASAVLLIFVRLR